MQVQIPLFLHFVVDIGMEFVLLDTTKGSFEEQYYRSIHSLWPSLLPMGHLIYAKGIYVAIISATVETKEPEKKI